MTTLTEEINELTARYNRSILSLENSFDMQCSCMNMKRSEERNLKRDYSSRYTALASDYAKERRQIFDDYKVKNPEWTKSRRLWGWIFAIGSMLAVVCCGASLPADETTAQNVSTLTANTETVYWNAENIPIPYLQDSTQYVSNPDHVLTQNAVDTINYYMKRVEQDFDVQSVIIVVNHIENDDPFRMAQDVGNRYGVGRKDRGLMVVVGYLDHKINISPGRSLEADLTDAEFTLVNTVDEEAGIKIDTVRPCTEKLTFGYTGPMSKAPVAGQSANGFYEAAAVLEESGIATAKIQIEPELKQAVKDFYHQHIQGQSARSSLTSISASDFSQLAKGIYQQFNGFAPRYGVKATWTDSLGTHSAMSGAGVAAIAVKPLSYAFFKDRSLKHLPNITPVSDLSDFNIDIKDIHFTINFNINHVASSLHLQAINFDFPDSLTAEITLPNVNGTPDPVTGEFPDSTYIAKASLENLEDSINNQFHRLIGIWNDSIDHAIDGMVNGLIDQINTQVQNFAGDIEGQLNSQIQDVVDDAKAQVVNKFGGYIDKVNKVIGKINAAINRVNRFLDNPNKFLQTTLAYEGKDKKFHLMSTTKTIPSVFTGSGAIMLYPTSYNAEIAAPAYKKFIAVTNVYKNDDMSVSAQGGNGACISALNAVNSQENFNEVLEGGRYGVAFVPTTGYTYEIFYAALDYHGMISQRKYYVTVK